MALPSIRRLALADLENETLARLVKHGEDLLVERKRELPDPPKFGAAAASFANTLGGWILLGVDDAGEAVGYEMPGKLDLQSHLADVLRREVDPLPPFVAATRRYEGKDLAILRVFESADAPHIVRGTGAVYVRTSKGREPVDDHRTLLELARRGDAAERRARERLARVPLIQQALSSPDRRDGHVRDPDNVRVLVRAAPLTVTPQFTDWPISDAGANHAWRVASELVSGAPQESAEPRARGVVARKGGPRASGKVSGTYFWGATLAADSAGVVAAALALNANSPLALDDLRRSWLRPLLGAVAVTLNAGEAYGRAACDCWVCLPGDMRIEGAQLQPTHPQMVREQHVAGEMVVPADDDELAALGRRWERELARGFGISRWESEPDEREPG